LAGDSVLVWVVSPHLLLEKTARQPGAGKCLFAGSSCSFAKLPEFNAFRNGRFKWRFCEARIAHENGYSHLRFGLSSLALRCTLFFSRNARFFPGIARPAHESRIYRIRGHKVLLDTDSAALYGVSTSHLNEAVHGC
jgi:hypothetical protein